ncbi:sensor domain-containing protein [Sulfurimonas marina]|uniref:EAL domain-containing protein n=1 Tax=Sulfurimonas marina TaxID=2590551 RepID=A0A7M1AUV9_9BACT|nr:EAL domain-containing protein [Sulfurimonas marina]QOP41217.1 EAL domain-containing protein [Sulfurimonas marina]
MLNFSQMFYTQLVDIAYKQLKFSSLANVINAAVLSFILFPYVNGVYLGLWFEFVLAISLYRFIMAKRYQSTPQKYSIKKWKKRFVETLIISTLIWIVVPFLFFIKDNYMVQAAIIIVYAGLSAGAISSLSSLTRTLHVFLVMFLLPLIIVLFLQQTQLHTAMAFLVSLYLGLLMIIGNKFHQNYKEIFKVSMMYEHEKEKFSVSKERFEIIFQGAPVGFVFYDKNLIIREVNQKLVDFLEAPRELLIGLDLHTIPDQRIVPALKDAIKNKNGTYDGKYITKFANKDVFINMQTSPVRDNSGKVIGAVGIVNDVTEKMHDQRKIERQAKYDILTDIPNRLTLIEQIEHEIIRYKRHRIIFAVLFLDLDHFKNINDSLGHAIGDKLLIEIAHRLRSIIRDEDIVARLGGDEFVVLLPDLSLEQKTAANKAEHVSKKVYESLIKPIVVEGHSLNISTSIGITLANSENDNADDILKHADIAMYQAKKDGRGVSRFYQQQMDLWIKRRLELENGLRDSLYNDELQVYFQPIVEFKSGEIIGAEALLRWNSNEFGSVSPEEFIPVAEESGLIVQIGDFVMKKAFEQFVRWKKESKGSESLQKIAINISVRQFNRGDFIANIKKLIDSSMIAPENVELEIVESIVIDDVKIAKEKMEELRTLGIKLSIDDFGTGYSSLSYLKQLPFTTLKIDKSFVKDINIDAEDDELIETILNIAKRFNLEVVAEGVETYEQALFLAEKDCEFFQGYYCSKAVNGEAFIDLLNNRETCVPTIKKD